MAVAGAAALVANCGARFAGAAEPAAGVGQSPLDRELFGPEVRPANPPGIGAAEGSDRAWAERLRRELGAAAESEDDPLWLRAVVRMEEAALSLQAGRAREAVEGQRAAVAFWDELLAAARRSGSSGAAATGGAATSNGNAQAADTPAAGGTRGGSRPVERPAAGVADAPQPSEAGEPLVGVLARLWGELPARLRSQVQQPLVEDFVPNYEAVTEQYFRRLAEQE